MTPTKSREIAADTKSEMKPRRREYTRKNDIVLEAAERVFLRSGYAGTSMDAVALEAGVSKRTVYSNFANKQALFADVIRRLCSDVLPDIPDLDEAIGLEPAEVLTELGIRFLKGIYKIEQIALYRTVVAEAAYSPDIGAMMFEGPIRHSQDVFERYLQAGTRAGLFDLSDPNLAATQLIGLLKTNLHMRLLMNQPTKLSPGKIRSIVLSCVGLFLNGAAARA